MFHWVGMYLGWHMIWGSPQLCMDTFVFHRKQNWKWSPQEIGKERYHVFLTCLPMSMLGTFIPNVYDKVEREPWRAIMSEKLGSAFLGMARSALPSRWECISRSNSGLLESWVWPPSTLFLSHASASSLLLLLEDDTTRSSPQVWVPWAWTFFVLYKSPSLRDAVTVAQKSTRDSVDFQKLITETPERLSELLILSFLYTAVPMVELLWLMSNQHYFSTR